MTEKIDQGAIEPAVPPIKGGIEESETPAAEGVTEAPLKDYDELYNRHLRLQAEFDNFRKRVDKEKKDFRAFAAERLVTELLPVLDHLEMALKHSREMDSDQIILEGIELVVKQFQEVLAKHGVEPIESMGLPFNPNFHEALSQVESEEHEDNTVVEEYQKGYTLGGRMLRPAKVTVSKKPDRSG